MDGREIVTGLGVALLALGALTLALAARRLVKRRRAGLRWFWGGLVMRVMLMVALLWSGVATLQHLPAPPFANRAAPAASGAIVVIHTQGIGGGLEGLSARDGSVRWQVALPQGVDAVIPGPPGVVFALGAAGASAAGALYAVRMADGALLWSHPGAGRTVDSYFPHPVIFTDSTRVYTIVPAARALALKALSLRYGATLWCVALPADSMGTVTSLALDGGMIFAVTDTQTVFWIVTAWRVSDGAQLWRLAAPPSATLVGDHQPVIAAAGGRVYLGANETQVLALDGRTGEQTWSARPSPLANDPMTPQAALATPGALYLAGQLQQANPAPSGGPNALPSTDAFYRLVAFDPSSGVVRWSARLAIVPGALTISDGALIASGQDGALETFDAVSGALLWNSELSLDTATPWQVAIQQYAPLVTPGAIFVMNSEIDPNSGACFLNCSGVIWLYAASPRDGTLWWRARVGPTSLSHWVI